MVDSHVIRALLSASAEELVLLQNGLLMPIPELALNSAANLIDLVHGPEHGPFYI